MHATGSLWLVRLSEWLGRWLLRSDPGNEDNDMQWLDEQEFYELMQAYRHAPLVDLAATVAAFEAVKQIIRDKCEESDAWPDSRRDCDW